MEGEGRALAGVDEVKFGSFCIVQIVPGNGVFDPAGVTVKEVTVKLVPAAEVRLTGELVCVAKLKLV